MHDAPKPLRILITNFTLSGRSGTEVYTYDLAIELLRRGHSPVVYSPSLGPLAVQLKKQSVSVIDDLSQMNVVPDVIHGHHCLETMVALLQFPRVPAVFVCHDADAWHDSAPKFPRIKRYVAVDAACRDRMIYRERISPEKTIILSNAFDLSRYPLRPIGPPTLRNAVLFSNYVGWKTGRLVSQSLRKQGIQTRLIGRKFGTETDQPERLLADADLVLGKGRCAWEGLVSGATVIPLDAQGMASMVTPQNFQFYSECNFGRRILLNPISPQRLRNELDGFAPDRSREVAHLARDTANLSNRVGGLVELYHQVILEQQRSPAEPDSESRASGEMFAWWAKHRNQHVRQRAAEKRVHRVVRNILRDGIQKLIQVTKA